MSNRRNRNNFYSVVKGRTVRIFTEWSQCKENIYKYHNCVHKGHKSLKDAIRFMASSGFTCQNVVIYDENMRPKKACAFGHKCENCSDSEPKSDDSDTEKIDSSEAPVRNEDYEIDSEKTIPKSTDFEDAIP